ncbi:MAG: competence/damage-inducible protein A [Nitrospinaceae bacterium]|nr:competence/damage-inducible protein A [Nitrospinaceae bacterium]NIR53555.1 competence/damage-inducible protein A [Nitrospinaceae bacterium]NIS83956.1 competence/damage-inducible protein A [Nitrospinaceae bacterium]NIT80765.1 competence/damage-inducible protein A [Nitrospinaceae bacterium]NIU43071.1 competence/damage-inducible protein A [Nitrospinaceae bacterium]
MEPIRYAVEILTVGNEIVTGLVQDTNSRDIARRLTTLGIAVIRHTSVGDEAEAISDALTQALARADCVILTGGLGATHDDITKKVLARYFDSTWVTDEEVRKRIKIIFRSRGREAPEAAFLQAEVPEKATVLHNEKGTAPGLMFEKDGKRVYSLPGVPLEVDHLVEKYIVPHLEPRGTVKVGHRILKTTGIPESTLWEEIGPVAPFEELVQVASLPSHLGVRIRFTATGKDSGGIQTQLDAAEKILRQKIDRHIFAVDDETMEGNIGELLKKSGQTVAVAESCTGGLIGHRLTNVPGSSDYFLEGAVTYSNEAKQNRLGVDPSRMDQFGAVSREVASAMAEGIRERAGSDVGLAVTGIAGPGGGSPHKPVGTTFIAVAGARGTHCEKFLFHQDRVRNQERAAQAALNLLRIYLKGDLGG